MRTINCIFLTLFFVQSLRNQCVRPVFLHQRGFKTNCGVVEVVINNSGKPLKTLAFFEMSQFVSFKPANLLVSDLTSMVKMPAKETFHAHLELAYPDSPIPYVVGCNNNSREHISILIMTSRFWLCGTRTLERCLELLCHSRLSTRSSLT